MGYRTVERKSSLGVQQSSSSQLPMIHVHIKEISKGTQKLNQIVKACRSGLGFGNARYSKEYGKELMQGAIELEQSLRMLVNIQEAYDYPTSSQKTNRIKLLDENGEEQDDDDDTQKQHEQMQLEMPSRYYQNIKEVARADIKVRLSTLAYPKDDNINRNKHLRASSHRRSVTCDEAGLSSFAVDNNRSKSSKPGTGRIPNVIAKLMGLGEFPEEDEDMKQKESALKTEIENDVYIKSVKVDQRRKDADLVMKNTGQKVIQANKVASLENLVAPKTKRNSTSMNIALDLVMHDETRVENATRDKTKSQKHICEKERGKDDENDTRRNNDVKGETQQVSSKNEAQRTTQYVNRRAIPTSAFQEEKEYKQNASQSENKQKTRKLLLRSQQQPQNHLSFEPKHMFHKSDPREARGGEKRYNENEQLQRRRQKANVLVTNHSPKPLSSVDVQKKLSLKNKAKAHRKIFSEADGALNTKRSPNGSHQLKPRSESLHFARVNKEDVNQKSSRVVPSPPDPENEQNKSDDPLGKKRKTVLIQGSEKAKEGNVHKGYINQARAKQNETLRTLTRPLEYQNSDSKEGTDGRKELISSHKDTDQPRSNKTEAAEERKNKSTDPVAGIQSPDRIVANDQKKIEDDSLLLMLITRENGSQILKEAPGQTPADEFQESMLRGGKGLQVPTSISDGNTLSKAVPKMLKGTRGEMETTLPKLEEPHKLPTRKITETLSESESKLKKIVLKSQLFLDAAEALFKLSIPLSILHTGGNDYNREDNNLILDCGYELMKRKGRLQELSIHPFVKVPISSSKVKSLEDLVKQLSKEFEKLRSYGREGCTEPVLEHYLPKILERDVQYKDPELNSMWDMGWNDSMLAFIERDDVIRDTERYVFNELVEEVTRDLLCI